MSADVALQLGVVVDAHLAADLGVLLLADGQLLGLAQQRHLLLAGHRIGGARRACSDEHRRKKEAGSFSHDPTCATPVPANSGLFAEVRQQIDQF